MSAKCQKRTSTNQAAVKAMIHWIVSQWGAQRLELLQPEVRVAVMAIPIGAATELIGAARWNRRGTQ